MTKADQLERVRSRGYCTGPVEGTPAPGEIDAGFTARCCRCGKRVRVTNRGLYAHHKPLPWYGKHGVETNSMRERAYRKKAAR